MLKLSFAFLIIIGILSSCKKDPILVATLPVNKTVVFSIAQGSDYSAPIYDDLQATVILSVDKENIFNGNTTNVWDTTFSLRSIREYAAPTAPLQIAKIVTGLIQSQEAVRVSRTVRYVNGLNQTWLNAYGESIPSYINSKQLLVNL